MLPDLSKLEQQYELPEGLLNAVMQAESSSDPNAVSKKGAVGLFQFMPETAKAYGIDPNDPFQAADGAARMYRDLHKQYGGNLDKMLMGYNWGSGNLAKHGAANAPKETLDYIAKVKAGMPKQYADAGTTLNDASGGLSLEQQQAIALAEAEAALEGEAPQEKQVHRGFDKNGNPIDTSTGRTVVDHYLQGVPLIGTFTDEALAIPTTAALKSYYGLTHNVPKMLGFDPLQPISAEDVPGFSEAIDMGNERLAAQLEENPGTAILSQMGSGLGIGLPFLKSLSVGSTGSQVANIASKEGVVANVADKLSKINDWAGRGNAFARAGKGLLTGVPTGYLYGLGDDSGEGRLENANENAIFGGGINAALPLVGAAGRKGAQLAAKSAQILAPKIDQQVAELAQTAMDKYGIPLTRSQVGSSGKNKLLASVAEKMPFSGGEAIYEKQQKAFNKAIAKSFGVDSDTITGRTIKEGYKVTGDLFDQALDGLSVRIDDDHIMNGLSKIQNDTQFISNDQGKIVNKWIDKFIEQANDKGFVPAEKLGSFRSDLTKAIQRTSGDAKNYLKDIRDVVVDASVAGDESRKEMLNDARFKYKNLKTVEDIATKAQGNSGNISPSLLMTPTKKSFSGTMSRGGKSDLEELARIGQQFLRQQPTSTTAERLQLTGQLGLPLGILLNPSSAPLLAAPSLGSVAFNALNRNQTFVKKAVQKAAQPKAISKSPLQSVATAAKKAVVP